MEAMVIQVLQEIKSYCKNNLKYKVTTRFCMVILRKLGYCLVFIAIIFQCTRQCVSKWIKRFEQNSYAGLEDLKRSGRPKMLQTDHGKDFENAVSLLMTNEKNILCQSGENLFKYVFNKIILQISRSTVYRFIKKNDFKKLLPRPIHVKNDKELMSKWKEEINFTINEVKCMHKEKEIEIYFQDESRFGQQTCRYRLWSKKGSRPTYIKQNGFLNSWIFGAINPKSGKKFGLILPKLDTLNMQIFLNKFSKRINYKKHAIVILDGSKAHRNSILKVPKNITLHFLPPYCPELNPIERLWLFIKKNYLSFKLYDTFEKLNQIGADSWNKINEEMVKSICRCNYLT